MTTNTSSWLSFNPTTRALSGTPGNSDVGVYWVEIKVDNGLFSNSTYFQLTVENVNDLPTIDTLNKEIAIELSISDRTVQFHLVNIFGKLGVGSRTEAVVHALKKGWLTLDDLP